MIAMGLWFPERSSLLNLLYKNDEQVAGALLKDSFLIAYGKRTKGQCFEETGSFTIEPGRGQKHVITLKMLQLLLLGRPVTKKQNLAMFDLQLDNWVCPTEWT